MEHGGDSAVKTPGSDVQKAWRRWMPRVLMVAFCITLILSVLAIWGRNQIANTDRYVRTVAPLASDPDIQNALADRVAEGLSGQLGAAVIGDQLPERERYLAAPFALMIEQYIHDIALNVVSSDRFGDLWEEMNRVAHPAISALLTGKESDLVSLEDGQVTLDLEPLLDQVIARLQDDGFDAVDRIRRDRIDTSFVLFASDDLAQIQSIVGWIEQLAIVLPIVAVGLLAAALIVATDRRRTLRSACVGVAASMILLILLIVAAKWWAVDQMPPNVDSDAATAFFDVLTWYMRRASLALLLLGLIIGGVVVYISERRQTV